MDENFDNLRRDHPEEESDPAVPVVQGIQAVQEIQSVPAVPVAPAAPVAPVASITPEENRVDEDIDTSRADASADTGSRESYQDNGRVYSFPRHDDNIRMDRGGAAVAHTSTSIYQILGWVCAALAAFASPFFAIPGIVFGVLVNRDTHRGGKAIIITNVVLAAINILFGLFFIAYVRNRIGRY